MEKSLFNRQICRHTHTPVDEVSCQLFFFLVCCGAPFYQTMFSDSFVFLKGKGTMSSDIDEFDDTSTFENKAGLAEDMRFLASIPEVNFRTKN